MRRAGTTQDALSILLIELDDERRSWIPSRFGHRQSAVHQVPVERCASPQRQRHLCPPRCLCPPAAASGGEPVDLAICPSMPLTLMRRLQATSSTNRRRCAVRSSQPCSMAFATRGQRCVFRAGAQPRRSTAASAKQDSSHLCHGRWHHSSRHPRRASAEPRPQPAGRLARAWRRDAIRVARVRLHGRRDRGAERTIQRLEPARG